MNQSTGGLRPLMWFASPLLIAAVGAWVAVVAVASNMGAMPGTMGLGIGPFAGVWSLMMVAMMLPSAWPFASLYVRSFGPDGRAARLAVFVSAYLLVWSATALPAYGLAWLADGLVGSHPVAARVMAVVVFGACGAYQLTPFKRHCLAQCRSPLGLIFKYGGYRGKMRDLRVGLSHGGFCVGCCWALMLLLVAFGFMNLIAMVVLAGAVLAEKMWAWGPRLGHALGVVALILAVVVVFQPGIAPALNGYHSGSVRMHTM